MNFIFFIIAVVAYTISQLQQHGKLRWSGSGLGFWDVQSWVRKYKKNSNTKPAFPGSTTIFVFVTDGYHLMQEIFKISLAFAISQKPLEALMYWVIFGLVFTISYKVFSK